MNDTTKPEWLELPSCKIDYEKLVAQIMKARQGFMTGKRELRRFKSVHFSSLVVGKKATLAVEFSRVPWGNYGGDAFNLDIKFRRIYHYADPERRLHEYDHDKRCCLSHKDEDITCINELRKCLLGLQEKVMATHNRRNAMIKGE